MSRSAVDRIRSAGRRLAARMAGSPRILAYHRITDAGNDPFGLCVTPGEFDRQINRFARVARPMRLSRLLDSERDGASPRNALIITFDDGYADNAGAALRILEKYEIPATIFIAAGYVGAGYEFWWDELERLAHHSRAEPLLEALGKTVGGTGNAVANVPRQGRSPSALLRSLWNAALPLPPGERDDLLDRLRAAAGVSPTVRDSHAILDAPGLRRLADHPLIDIGSHGMTHTMMAALPQDDQRRELADSRNVLEELLDRPIRDYSYPFGFKSSWTPGTESALRAAGYRCACTTVRGRVMPNADVYRLPREMVRGPAFS